MKDQIAHLRLKLFIIIQGYTRDQTFDEQKAQNMKDCCKLYYLLLQGNCPNSNKKVNIKLNTFGNLAIYQEKHRRKQ